MAGSNDAVVKEIDVFLSKSLAENLYVFQYPVRPSHSTYDDMTYVSSRIKPKQHKVELELSLNTRSSTYDKSKGEQIALNVDGQKKDDNSYFGSSLMDKQILTSTQAVEATSRYAVGFLKNGELHLNPLRSIIQLRPCFSYLDRSDAKQKQESRDRGDAESSGEEEEEAKAVTVKFARPETERIKKMREKSYRYLQQKMLEEPWRPVNFHYYKSERSVEEKKLLTCSKMDNETAGLGATPKEYLHMLVPDDKDADFNKPSLPTNVMSMAQLRTLPLSDQIKSLLTNAKIIRFSQLLALLSSDIDSASVLRALQHVAMLVQGCWIVKSEILYPKDSCSAHSGVPAEILCRGRDYVMWCFTQNRLLVRKEVAEIIKLPPEDVKDILEQMARSRGKKGWEFLFPFDQDFINRNPEVVQRQQLLWDARSQALLKNLRNIISSADKGAGGDVKTPSPVKNRRRRTKSRQDSFSSENDASGSELNRPEAGDSLKKREIHNPATVKTINADQLAKVVKSEPMEMSSNENNNAVENNESAVDPSNCPPELINFIRDRLSFHKCTSLSELRSALANKILELPFDHVLKSNFTNQALENAALLAGASRVTAQWPNDSTPEPLFAVLNTDELGDYPNALFSVFRTTFRCRKGVLKRKVEEAAGQALIEADFVKLLKEYCVGNRNGMYTLKGISSSTS